MLRDNGVGSTQTNIQAMSTQNLLNTNAMSKHMTQMYKVSYWTHQVSFSYQDRHKSPPQIMSRPESHYVHLLVILIERTYYLLHYIYNYL